MSGLQHNRIPRKSITVVVLDPPVPTVDPNSSDVCNGCLHPGSDHVRRNEQTERVWAVYASLILVRRATNTVRRALFRHLPFFEFVQCFAATVH